MLSAAARRLGGSRDQLLGRLLSQLLPAGVVDSMHGRASPLTVGNLVRSLIVLDWLLALDAGRFVLVVAEELGVPLPLLEGELPEWLAAAVCLRLWPIQRLLSSANDSLQGAPLPDLLRAWLHVLLTVFVLTLVLGDDVQAPLAQAR